MPHQITDTFYRVREAAAKGERRPKWLVVTVNGPLAWGRACPFCAFSVMHRKQRGSGSAWGKMAKANAAVAAHIREAHPEKLED